MSAIYRVSRHSSQDGDPHNMWITIFTVQKPENCYGTPCKNCILKAVYVAQERYCSFKFRSHWNYRSSYFNFHFCRLNSAPASLWWKIKTELIYRKKSTSNQNHLALNQSFLNLKFQIDYKVTVVKTYSECFINGSKLQISFSLENFELKKNHFGSNKVN